MACRQKEPRAFGLSDHERASVLTNLAWLAALCLLARFLSSRAGRKKGLLVLLCATGLVGSGCSGINMTKSVSPLDFLLPGLMQSTPATNAIPEAVHPAFLLARNADAPSRCDKPGEP